MEDKEELIENIEDELNQTITDPVKESTVDYYLKKKDQVVLKTNKVLSFKYKVFCGLYTISLRLLFYECT